MNRPAIAKPACPDFLVIGAQKAGTTWLHRKLRQCPSIFLPEDKDFEYFSYPESTPAHQYRARFQAAPRNCRRGDVCASYFWTVEFGLANAHFNRNIPATVQRSLGAETDILVLLRDPVERALSAYVHHIAFGTADPATGILETPGNLGIIAMSRYGANLANWLRYFPRERLCLLPAPGEAPASDILQQALQALRLGDCAVPNAEDRVFPGLPRMRDHDGLWVRVDRLATLPAGRKVAGVGNGRRVNLVSTSEIERLTAVLRPDTLQLAETLRQLGSVHPAFGRWSTWPGV